MTPDDRTEECCPKFDPGPWEDKFFTWDRKKFVKDKVRTLFHVPLNFGAVMKRITRKADKSGAKFPDWLSLSDHRTKWTMDVYVAVDKEVEGAVNTTLSGQYFSKVYEGDFKETGAWCKDFAAYAAAKGLAVKKWYMWYTTCPKCAKKYGKNYVAIVAEVEGEARP
jgi:hypothetical protein